MDSPRSGHDEELISIKNDLVSLTIKGPACHPKLINKDFSDDWSAVKVSCEDGYELKVFGSENPLNIHPLFFEQQNYEVLLQYNAGTKVEFWHDNLSIREKVSPIKLNGELPFEMQTGIINFRSNIGYSDLVILVDGRRYLTLTIEVFPVKLDYKNDYEAIMEDLTKELYNLIFEFLRETYKSYKLGSHKSNSLVEFLEIIKHIYSDFMKAIGAIIVQPHHVLKTEHEVVSVHKVKHVDNRSIKWLERHSGSVAIIDGKLVAEKVLAARKEIKYDTRENQLTKFILQSIVKRLNEFKRKYMAMDRVKNNGPDQEGVLNPINKMIAGINNKLNSSFLKDVSAFKGQGQLSLVFSMALGYRELYGYYMILQHGLDLSGDVFHMSLKDLADLYEYWCFIKLNSILNSNDKYKLTSKDIIRANRSGLFITLIKNKQKSTVRYETENGEKIALAYNASGKYPTGPQKPDNTLSLSKYTQQGEKKYQYVFDAKYKVNPAMPGTYYYNHISKLPGPEEEDINTMHRYRDAIVSLHEKEYPWERLMFGAYVLFPLSGGEEAVNQYKEHIFYKSIGEVNIGGLPFLPSSTQLVEELLDALIEEPAEEAEKRPPRQINSDTLTSLYKAVAALTKEERAALGVEIQSNVNNGKDTAVIERKA